MAKQPIHGRGPNGRALKSDGTERKPRATYSGAERLAILAAQRKAAMANIGREILSAAGNEMAAFVSGIANFRRYVREARAYATEDSRAARRAYFEAQIALIEAKGKAAEKYLDGAEKASEGITRLMENIGADVSAFTEKNGRMPNGKEVNEMISAHISSDLRKIVEEANDPAKDVFHGLRRGDDSQAD